MARAAVSKTACWGFESLLAWGSGDTWGGVGKVQMLANIRKFFSEVRAEMQKVTWSTREEIMGSTGVVLITMLILSTFIGVADFFLAHALSVLLR